jgi:hypothetical protein
MQHAERAVQPSHRLFRNGARLLSCSTLIRRPLTLRGVACRAAASRGALQTCMPAAFVHPTLPVVSDTWRGCEILAAASHGTACGSSRQHVQHFQRRKYEPVNALL